MARDTPWHRALLAITLVAIAGALAAVPASGAAGTLLVGFAPGEPAPAAVAQAGHVVAIDAALGLAVVETADADAALAWLQTASGIQFVERDGAARSATASTDSARWDSSSWDSSRWDSSSWDSSRWDSSRWDSSRWDSSRWDSSRWDSSRWDSSRWDSSRWDSSRWDSSRWDESVWDASSWDSSRWDSSRWDSSRWDSSRWDSSRWDASSWDSSRWDGNGFAVDPLFLFQWGLADLHVPDAWAISAGNLHATICVLDTGVDATHEDLAPNMWTAPDGTHGRSFVGEPTDTSDTTGHGTHVAGIAAAATGNGIGIAGVGNAQIMVGKVLNEQGIGGLGTLARGIRWCADAGADVISMSLSSDQDSQAVRRAVAYAQDAGALLIASAGNAQDACGGCPKYPAAYDGVLGVTALDQTQAAASFANGGAHADLAAPGDLIVGTAPGNAYVLGSGTSQATALVSGLAALAWDLDPTLTASQMHDLLIDSARDLATPGWDAATGWGEPDAHALLQSIAAG